VPILSEAADACPNTSRIAFASHDEKRANRFTLEFFRDRVACTGGTFENDGIVPMRDLEGALTGYGYMLEVRDRVRNGQPLLRREVVWVVVGMVA